MTKQKQGTLRVIALWAGIIVMVYVIVASGSTPVQACPHQVDGAEDAELKIEYFGSKTCPYCWKQEPIFKDLAKQHPDKVRVEHYNVNHCGQGVQEYQVTATPTLVFSHNGKKEISRGFVDEIGMKQIMCDKLNICEG